MALATLLHICIRSCSYTVEHFSPIAVIHNGANKIQLFDEEYTYPVKKLLHQETNWKTESVIKRIRWKAFFFEQNKVKNKTNRDNDNDDSNSAADSNFGFKSRKCPLQNEELNNFEADVYDMITWLMERERFYGSLITT